MPRVAAEVPFGCAWAPSFIASADTAATFYTENLQHETAKPCATWARATDSSEPEARIFDRSAPPRALRRALLRTARARGS
jgi:hypothetical protein